MWKIRQLNLNIVGIEEFIWAKVKCIVIIIIIIIIQDKFNANCFHAVERYKNSKFINFKCQILVNGQMYDCVWPKEGTCTL